MRFLQSSDNNYTTNDREGILCQSLCTGGFGTSSNDLVIDVDNDGRVADAADAAADDDGGSIYSDGTSREGAPTVSQKLRGIFACIRRCMVFGGCGRISSVGKLRKVNGRWQYDGPVKSHCLGGDDENEPPHEQKAEKQKSTTSGGSNAGHKRTSRTTRRESIRNHDITAPVTAKRRRTQNNDDEDEYKDDEDESDDDDHDIKFIKKKKNKNKDKKDEVSILCVIIYIYIKFNIYIYTKFNIYILHILRMLSTICCQLGMQRKRQLKT